MILSKADFAKFTGYSSRQVGLWLDDGLPTAPGDTGGRGKARQIDTALAIRWLLDRASGNAQPGEMQESKRSLVDARANKIRLEAGRLSGELLDREDVQIVINELLAVLVSGLTSLPGRLVAALAGQSIQPSVIQRATQREVRTIRTIMSDKLAALAAIADSPDPWEPQKKTASRKKAATRKKTATRRK